MTREEEIKKRAFSFSVNYPPTDNMGADVDYKTAVEGIEQGFIRGAKWADETMIEKAREWVKNAFTGPFGEGMANSIADEFVKAMKGD